MQMTRHKRAWIIAIGSLFVIPGALILLFGFNPAVIFVVATIMGIGIVASSSLEQEALEEKKVDVNKGSQTGNVLAKVLAFAFLLLIVFLVALDI